MSFRSVLVANRGEIALRIMKTCVSMGLETVAVYSDADEDSPHVAFADRAVRIGPAAATDSYLKIDVVIEAARRAGADAIHPGYGFLAENAEFAEAVVAAGLIFIGPTSESIRLMGDKSTARTLMEERGVPVAPGYTGDDQSDERLITEAAKIGYPVLVKAAAGGGGKGMSIVRSADALQEAVATARRLAASAFGNDTLLLESYIDNPRHIEVQIVGDTQGSVIHCFERECSVQRRFQKIIEEAPSVAVTESLRTQLCAAAVTAGETLGYVGAGTVEFIMAPDGAFYFLEVNTRLQVEHPVTEMITGLDLVELQLRVARGEALPAQETIRREGHAVECRLYAEDASRDFLPATGQLISWEPPSGAHVRVDAGINSGSVIGIDYDPMLAKVITYGSDRHVATDRMIRALKDLRAPGLTTNQGFLIDVLEHKAYRAGDLSTHFIPNHMAGWSGSAPRELCVRRIVVAVVWSALIRGAQRTALQGVRPGWRNNAGEPPADLWHVTNTEETFDVRYTQESCGRFLVSVGEQSWAVKVLVQDGARVELCLSEDEGSVTLRESFRLYPDGQGGLYVADRDGMGHLAEAERFPRADQDDVAGGCIAPMPGRVVSVAVSLGDSVTKGQTLVVLEAMKMEQAMTASVHGTVTAVACAAGDIVDSGAVLIEVTEAEEQ
jgi:propionyl-CoA carboxylase alpha chain